MKFTFESKTCIIKNESGLVNDAELKEFLLTYVKFRLPKIKKQSNIGNGTFVYDPHKNSTIIFTLKDNYEKELIELYFQKSENGSNFIELSMTMDGFHNIQLVGSLEHETHEHFFKWLHNHKRGFSSKNILRCMSELENSY